jgi:hypothetical protein
MAIGDSPNAHQREQGNSMGIRGKDISDEVMVVGIHAKLS